MGKLKTCPFCGGDVQGEYLDEYDTISRWEGENIYFFVHCYHCDCEWHPDVGLGTGQELVRLWNRRA